MGTKKRLVGCAFAVVLVGLLAFTSLATAKPQPGDLDRSFSGNGTAFTSFGSEQAYAHAVAIGRKGRIVVAGFQSGGGVISKRFAVVRYKPNGDRDHSFSHDGRLSTPFPGSYAAGAYDVAIGHKGSIVVAGQACPSPVQCSFAVAKYRSDGHLDKSFGDGGRVKVSFPGHKTSFARGVAITSGGRVLLGGTACPQRATFRCKFALAQLDSSGELDPAFGNGGRVITTFTDNAGAQVYSLATAMAVNSRGRIVLGGNADGQALACYEPNGDPVSSFGKNGKLQKNLQHFHGEVSAIATDAKNKIVMASDGYSVARLDPDGGRDRSFGKLGQVTTDVGEGHAKQYGLAIDSRNRIVTTGSPHFTLVRYQPNGKLNKSFGGNGIARAKLGSGWPFGLAIDSHDRPVAAGFVKPRSSPLRVFAVGRFLG